MIEFDLVAAPTELTIVRYFEKNLKPYIKAEIDQDTTHLDNYEELIAKAVKTEAKAGLQPSFYVRKTDIQVLQRSQPAYTTAHKVQTQKASHRDDSKAFKASTFTQESKPFDKARKVKKKRHHRDKRDSRKPRDTPVSRVNAAEVGDKKRKRKKKDLKEVTCYNSNKLGHYADQCLKSRKSKNKY